MSNRRIPLEDFLIFLKPDPLIALMKYYVSYEVGAIDRASETPYKKRKSYKKHADGKPKKVKISRRTLETSTEEPRVVVAISFDGTVSSKSFLSEPQIHFIVNNSSIPSSTTIYPFIFLNQFTTTLFIFLNKFTSKQCLLNPLFLLPKLLIQMILFHISL